MNEKEKRKDHKYKDTGKKKKTTALPPVRNRGQNISESLKLQPKKKNESETPKVDAQTEAKLKEMRRDATPMKDYYKAWDKLATAIDEEADQDEIDTNKI